MCYVSIKSIIVNRQTIVTVLLTVNIVPVFKARTFDFKWTQLFHFRDLNMYNWMVQIYTV